MNINEENIKFYQYDALQTKRLRNEWRNKSDKEIAELAKQIDEDHIEIEEEKCSYKKPRIGPEYQVEVSKFVEIKPTLTKDSSGNYKIHIPN